MNLKLQKLITAFNEKKNFFNNHPDVYQFIDKTFGENIPVGTKISINVERPNGNVEYVDICIDEKDKKFVDSLSEILGK